MHRLTRTFLVALVCAAPAPAAATMNLTGIDAMTSTVMQEGQSSFSGLAVRARMTSPLFIPGFAIMPTVEYWRNANSIEAFGIRTTRKDATLGADVYYAFRPTGTRPYVGAGFALHFLSSTVDAPSFGLDHESHALVRGGVGILAGLAFPLADRFDNFVELKYHHVSGYRQLKLNWGLSVKL